MASVNVTLRKKGSSATARLPEVISNGGDTEIFYLVVPVDVAERFQYKMSGTGLDEMILIADLIGYFK